MKSKNTLLAAAALFLFVAASYLGAQEWVTFERGSEGASSLQLSGILTVPTGTGPFPAVVMLCGCGGLKSPRDAKQQKTWAGRFAGWGYVSLQVDSFGPRGFDSICQENVDRELIDRTTRAKDAFAAKVYLSRLGIVDSKRMAVAGWSHGGWTITAVIDAFFRAEGDEPFRAAVAFYPLCAQTHERDTPLLVLAGAKDDFSPLRLCRIRFRTLNGEKIEQKLVVYPNAYHSFDFEEPDEYFQGHLLQYDPEATADAIIQTRDFLAKYLKSSE